MPKRSEKQRSDRYTKEKLLGEKYKKYYEENSHILKICASCGIEKKLSEFASSYAMKHKCKECRSLMVKRWRSKNPYVSERIRTKGYEKSAEYIRSHKNKPCKDCGKTYNFYQMDFNHLGSKSINISQLYGKSQERIDAEIAKCELICANCHRDKTFRDKDSIPVLKNRTFAPDVIDIEIYPGYETKKCISCSETKNIDNFTSLKTGCRHSYCKKCLRQKNAIYNKKRDNFITPSEIYVQEYKDNKPCTDCGEIFRYWKLDLDHRDGVYKKKNVNTLRRNSLELIKEEIAKCDIVCVNCHRERTWQRRQKNRELGVRGPGLV